MNVFDQIKEILEVKDGKMLHNLDNYQEFEPYIISRWISMYDPSLCSLINETTNILYKGIDNKEQWYKLLIELTPKTRGKYINYLKKNKKEKPEVEDSVIEELSKDLQISKREVMEYISHEMSDKKKIKEIYK